MSADPDGADRRTTLADQRTSLAGERTLLAWWRTGLTALAVALGVGRVLPELAPHATRWPYVVLGIGFALYGIAMFLIGARRMGGGDRMLAGLLGSGVILGLASLALIATN